MTLIVRAFIIVTLYVTVVENMQYHLRQNDTRAPISYLMSNIIFDIRVSISNIRVSIFMGYRQDE